MKERYKMYYDQNKIRNPELRALIELIMDVTNGHDHDGTNSKAVSVGTVGDGSVTNAKVAADAAIALSKLASTTAAYIIVANAGGVLTAVPLSGDGSIGNDGAIQITDLTITDEAQGDILIFDGTNWVRLAAGNAGQSLISGGAGADPSWGNPSCANLPTATPVNAVAAQGTLTIAGVVIDGEYVDIGDDRYEFCADAAQSLTAGSDFAVDITSYVTKSQGTLTVVTQPISGDTMTIGDKVFTFVTNGTANADGEISIGTDAATAQANIVAAINGTDGWNTASAYVTIAAFAANAAVLTALVGGVAGDSIATTETFNGVGNIFDAATLGTTTAGVDCSAANAVTALVAAITANDTQGVGAADGAGDTVVLTADTKGAAGNAIVIAESMANGSLDGGGVLGGTTTGVDGTVGTQWQVAVDASYIYICIAANTIADANWRRVTLGSVY